MERTLMDDRLTRLRAAMADRDLDTFVSVKFVNTYYLSGFTSLDTGRPTTYTRPIVVIVDSEGATLVIPALNDEPARATSVIQDIRSYAGGPVEERARELVVERLREVGARRVGVEEDAISSESLAALRATLPGTEFVFAADAIEQLRIRKDEAEVELLRQAAELSDAAVRASLAAARPGLTELEAETAGLLALREAAAAKGESAALDLISVVLSGPRGSMPHEMTSGRRLQDGDALWSCWLVGYRGYWIENIRMATVGDDGGHADGYELVREALLAGQDAARPGETPARVYAAVIDVLEQHSIPGGRTLGRAGHGMGLEYHEPPFVESADSTPLEPGMVITVEPGIWIPGVAGLTLSNTLVIRDGEPEILPKASLTLHASA
jgi:Xaa-Pro aminopeptidase